ncbi:hypothetical protein [Brevibacillus aydinogluensis]|nr:hypothetical protein [Brevibacillus aydinogluensis]
MKNLVRDIFTIIRIALIFLATFALSSLLFFRFFYDGKNDELVFLIQLVVVFHLPLTHPAAVGSLCLREPKYKEGIIMSTWIFLSIIVGGLLVFGVVYDRVTKRKANVKDLDTAMKNSSPSNMVYKETFLHEQQNKIHDYNQLH